MATSTPMLDDLASGQEEGRFDTDTYARVKAFLARNRAAPAKVPAKVPAKAKSKADLPPAGAYRGKRSDVSGQMSEVKRPGTNVTYDNTDVSDMTYKRGGAVKGYAKGGSVSSASSRADGCAQRGKTRGVMVACGGGYMKGKK